MELNNLINLGRSDHEEHVCEIIFEFGPMVKERIWFKDISYLELWWPLCLAEQYYLSNFGKSIMRNNSVKLF